MPARPAPLLALVVPCYNEEETLPRTLTALAALLERCKAQGLIRPESYALYVDDGSRDRTWQLLEARHRQDPFCRGVSFAANAGHQNAVWAGMDTARQWGADCIISLDADLQDDIGVIPDMLARYAEGCDIVYGVRNDRSTDTAFKRCWRPCGALMSRRFFCAGFSPRWASKPTGSIIPGSRGRPEKANTPC